jgi:hypothetical protein
MGSGGGSSTTKNELPKWASPYAQEWLKGYDQLAFPGGSPASYPLPDKQVANVNPYQPQAANITMDTLASSPAAYSPFMPGNMDPYLQPYFDQAAKGVVNQYQLATAPEAAARAASTGTIGSSGDLQNRFAAQYGMGQNLASLGAQVYEPAFEASMNRGLQATNAEEQNLMTGAQQLGSQAQGLQQSQHGVYDESYNNTYNRAMWPYQLYDKAGGVLSSFVGNSGVQKVSAGGK